jgi:hypothetical protein
LCGRWTSSSTPRLAIQPPYSCDPHRSMPMRGEKPLFTGSVRVIGEAVNQQHGQPLGLWPRRPLRPLLPGEVNPDKLGPLRRRRTTLHRSENIERRRSPTSLTSVPLSELNPEPSFQRGLSTRIRGSKGQVPAGGVEEVATADPVGGQAVRAGPAQRAPGAADARRLLVGSSPTRGHRSWQNPVVDISVEVAHT